MNILFVITGLGVGGAERQVTALADRLSSLGHAITIAYLTGPAKILPISLNVQVVPLNMSKTPWGVAKAYINLRALISSLMPDVVHSHMVHANLLTRLIRLTLSFPRLVCTAHNSNEGGKFRMLMYRITDSLADVSSNVSEEATNMFQSLGAVPYGRMIPVYNGVDCSKFSPDEDIRKKIRDQLQIQDFEIFVLSASRLVVAKNYPNLLKAFAAVRRDYPFIKLGIAGDGPLRHSLEAIVDQLALNKSVFFLGVRGDIPDLMRAADVFVLSSSWEGFGLVVAEAMATERIVVATDCGGVREVLGDCGILVPVDDVTALEQGLRNAFEMKAEEALALGRAARERVLQEFSLDFVTNTWLQIYDQ